MACGEVTTSSPIIANNPEHRRDGGTRVPYYGIVECRLRLPEIEGFQKDVLMLVIDDSSYGKKYLFN